MITRREMNWKIIRSLIPIIALGSLYYYTQSMKIDYKKEKPVLVTTAKDLIWRFQVDSSKDILLKIVQVEGEVTGMDSLLLILNHKLICAPEPNTEIKTVIGDSITVKGRCIGYDDLLDEVRMDHVFWVQN